MRFTDHPAEADAPTALILPGADYPSQAPLLYWTQGILLAEGWRVIAGEWADVDREAAGPQDAVEAALNRVRDDGTTLDLVVGKSLGSFAAPHCVAARTAGVWLTPLLNVPAIA